MSTDRNSLDSLDSQKMAVSVLNMYFWFHTELYAIKVTRKKERTDKTLILKRLVSVSVRAEKEICCN